MSEAKLQSDCIRLAKRLGCMHVRVDPKGNVGAPDVVFFLPADAMVPLVIPVEFKVGKNKRTAKQVAWADKLSRECGRWVEVVYTLDEFKGILSSHGLVVK